MRRPRPRPPLCLVLLVALAFGAGCGAPRDGHETMLREEALSSLEALVGAAALRYRLHLETWVGVSGQTVYGDELCEGSRTGEGFHVSVRRSTPTGVEEFALLVSGKRAYGQDDGAWHEMESETRVNPLYDPANVAALAKRFQSAILEGEEELEGVPLRRVLLRLDPGAAEEVLTEGAWSYFSSLRFDPLLRVWIDQPSSPPHTVQLELLGYDPTENLLRYRLLATLEPFDLDAPDISLPVP